MASGCRFDLVEDERNLLNPRQSQLRQHDGPNMMLARNLTLATSLIAASNLVAGTLVQPLYGIDFPDGWTYSTEASTRDDWSDLVTFRKVDEDGHLKIISYHAPVEMTEEQLRGMTNIDSRVTLTWQHWGDFAGYQYAYEEEGSYYIQWFLVNGKTLLLITYQGEPVTKDNFAQELAPMIRSLKINPPVTR